VDDAAFTDEFCRFIQTSVPSVETAELLLLLLREPERWWKPEELPGALPPGANVSGAEVARLLELLRARALITVDGEQRVRYSPGSADADKLVGLLAQAYRERPVTLIRVIYALRDSKIRSFAEAFRFRKG
jgi:hypothetical protein